MRLPKPFISILTLTTALLAVFLVGCQSRTPAPQQTPVDTPASSPVPSTEIPPLPSPSATAEQSRTLVLCTQEEPQSLYIYGGSSRSMWSVLEAIYDGPIDQRDYSAQPVILQKIPSLADGDAVLQPVNVQAGDLVIDADGNLAALAAGTSVLPSGCASPDCAVAWDGSTELSMDQLVVTFDLLPGLQWSDGAPLTAEDSVFSYRLAADPATPASKYLTDRTFSYEAPDEQTAVWTGIPGFFEQRYGTFFWHPLPGHILGDKSAAGLLIDDASVRAPIGWGPYVIDEWIAGDHITLRKNENYFRAAEGLPKFETLVYRFIGDTSDGNLNALLAGECDAVDQNPQFLEIFPGLEDRVREQKLSAYVGQGPEWEHLDFGVRSDDGSRPDFFGDARTRRAFAHCIDRAAINDQYLYGRSTVSSSYLPATHPMAADGLQEYPYDPSRGAALLDEVGWRDIDNDPATPRTAVGVSGVPDGTPLSVTYLTTEAPLRVQTAESAADSLRSCGIEVSVQPTNPGELFQPGPDGLVFGRKFDLVQFSWEASARPNCLLYTSAQVPTADNRWIGSNITGFSSPEFDTACASAFWARTVDPDYAGLNQAVQEEFSSELPVIPLFSHLKIAISRPDLCGLEMDVTARSIFSDLENLDYGTGCTNP